MLVLSLVINLQINYQQGLKLSHSKVFSSVSVYSRFPLILNFFLGLIIKKAIKRLIYSAAQKCLQSQYSSTVKTRVRKRHVCVRTKRLCAWNTEPTTVIQYMISISVFVQSRRGNLFINCLLKNKFNIHVIYYMYIQVNTKKQIFMQSFFYEFDRDDRTVP